jgi:hypothetical protein
MQQHEIERIANRQAEQQLEMLARGLTQFDEAVSRLADADASYGVAKLLSMRVGLHLPMIVTAVEAQSDEPTTVICRAAGLKMNAYSALLRMRRRRIPGTQASPAEALSAYQKLPQDAAGKVLELLRGRADQHAGE